MKAKTKLSKAQKLAHELEHLEENIKNSYEVPNNVLKAVPKPMVTIRTSAYQHAPYIKQCIESILAQQTNFDFEFIIGEDFSTDGTREIVMEYARKYPDIIRVITADYNVGVKANGFRCIRAMRGKYVAICEGDDYWTDPKKLQRQIDFLEKHADYALSFHPVRVKFENKSAKDYLQPAEHDASLFTVEELLRRNFIQTNSVVYRRRKDYSDYNGNVIPGDWYMHLYHAQFGKIHFIDKAMSVYRRHPGGMWWDSINDPESLLKNYGVAWLGLYLATLRIFGKNKQHRQIIEGSIITMFKALDSLDKKEASDLLAQAITQYPEATLIFIRDLRKEAASLDDHSKEQAKIIDHYLRQNQVLETEIQDLRATYLVRLEDKRRSFVEKMKHVIRKG